MNKTKNLSSKPLRGGFLVLAAVFFFNPHVSVLDVLPDFIGCILIICAISKLADSIEYFADARSALIKFAIVSASRLPVWVFVVSVTADHLEHRGYYTVFTLAYLVVEFIYAIPAIKSLFLGFGYLAERFGCEEAAGTKKNSCDAVANFTAFMLVFKNLMAFLPDLCFLYSYDNVGDVTRRDINWLEMRPYFLLAGLVLALIIGILWMAKYIPYVKGLGSASDLSSIVSELREGRIAHISKKNTFRFIYAALTFLAVGTFFNVDFPIDNMDIAPDFISAACYLVAVLLIGRAFSYRLPAIVSCVVYLITSAVAFAISYSFFSEYEYEAIAKSESAYEAYSIVKYTSLLDSLLQICVSVVLMLMLMYILNEHTELPKRKRRSMKRSCIIFGVLGSLNAILSAVYSFTLALTKEEKANGKYVDDGIVILPEYEGFWIFVMIAGLIWMLYTLYIAATLKGSAEEKYLYS